jgi:hypothetical protein
MAMRYERVRNEHFIYNGGSCVRVEHVASKPSPLTKGRIVRIFQVVQLVRINPQNPIQRGTMLAVSFPGDRLGAESHQWRPGEEKFVAMEVTDRAVTVEALNQKAKETRKAAQQQN